MYRLARELAYAQILVQDIEGAIQSLEVPIKAGVKGAAELMQEIRQALDLD